MAAIRYERQQSVEQSEKDTGGLNLRDVVQYLYRTVHRLFYDL